MTHVDPSVPQHLAELYQELTTSRATLLALIEAEGSGIHRRTLDQLDRMIAEIFLVHRVFPGKAALIFRKK